MSYPTESPADAPAFRPDATEANLSAMARELRETGRVMLRTHEGDPPIDAECTEAIRADLEFAVRESVTAWPRVGGVLFLRGLAPAFDLGGEG